MPEPPRISSLLWTALLYVLAAPIIALRALGRLLASRRMDPVVRAGFLKCPHCRHGNRLDVLVTCARCGFAEFRSLALPCGECGFRVPWIYCASCGASLRLP